MTGLYHIIIQNSIVKYEFDIRRNITIIKGDSATGKTVLVNLVQEYEQNGIDSGITIDCDIPCRVINGNNWEDQLNTISNSIVFIDEGNRFVSSQDFAEYVKKGQNYYVIVTREKLDNLPYSVTEIYGIHSSGKYESLIPVYHEMYRIYDRRTIGESLKEIIHPSHLIVEDSNSGYDFFCYVAEGLGNLSCASAYGKSKIFDAIIANEKEGVLLVIADGAAFGPEMERVYELIQSRPQIHLYLPESFEWLVLKSGIVRDSSLIDKLENTEDFADSTLYFSWEQYYTKLLIALTKKTYLAYNKQTLNSSYKNINVKKAILKVMQGIELDEER